ncbi:MAG: homoserine kinase [Ignavibacteriales bacterium]|nr:homoserine kinase [Ignavibacteriales bacterium]
MVRVRVPASTSNLGPGFDVLGLALNRYLIVSGEADQQAPLTITVEGEGINHIATDSNNLVYQGICAALHAAGRDPRQAHLRLHLENNIPAYGGLGGSGAACTAGIVLANRLFDLKLSETQMLTIGLALEGHPDNISASMMGGLTVNCYDGAELHTRSIMIEYPLLVVTCSPHFQLLTSEARKILPASISRSDVVVNLQNVASLVAAMMAGDMEALRYVTAERIHEQYRATLIPGFDDVRRSALEAGALSCNISGSGPTIFCFATYNEEAIGSAMQAAFLRAGLTSSVAVMNIENEGASII